jgi:uncharacterized repeat protein (TIGR02543 family)
MKTMLSLWRHHYTRTFSILLIAVFLIAGVASCTTPTPEYDLTMAVNPAGIGTATDLTGTSPYARDEVVDISAVPPEPCYQFVGWTAPAGTFGDANNATTTFTMPAQDVTVTANFEFKSLDHFKCYWVDPLGGPPEEIVTLEDQFVSIDAEVRSADLFCNPVEKMHGSEITSIANPDDHFAIYNLEYEEDPVAKRVGVTNQFGTQELTVYGPVKVAVPTQKIEPGDHAAPTCLDHYLLYEVIDSAPMEPVLVILNDEFEAEPDAFVVAPRFLANPVKKTHGSEVSDITDTDTHLVFYDIEVSGGNGLSPTVDVAAKNQFGDQSFVAYEVGFLAVPSEKTVLPTPPLEHFRGYWVDPAGGIEPTPVLLEDQFHAGEPISTNVIYDWFFCNPVEKWLDEEHGSPIWYPDDHLYIYGIDYAATEYWQLEVSNQFGGTQLLTVFGPVALAVPTQKEGHEAPVDLDHYLLYTVVPPYPEVFKPVYLRDQFIDGQEATVTVPLFFANPVKKTHGDAVTLIKHPNAHLVFYGLDIFGSFATDWITATNQFGAQEIVAFYPSGEGPTILGVPSMKLWWETYIPL